jgi:hypothetical protein
MGRNNGDRDGVHRRVLLGLLGALGLSAAAGSADASEDGPSVATDEEEEEEMADDGDHGHGGERLGADEPLAALTAKRVNGVRHADAFDGETSAARITNAIDDLP